MLNNYQTGCFDPSTTKYIVGTVFAIVQGYRNLLVLLAGKLLKFRWLPIDWTGKIDEFALPSNEFVLLENSTYHVCLYSTPSLLLFDKSHYKFVLQLTIDNLIHVNFFGLHEEGLIVCSKGSKSIAVWNCLKGTLIEEYWFNESIVKCSTIQKYDHIIIKVTLETRETRYLYLTYREIDENFEVILDFKIVAILKQQPEQESIFFNVDTDIYYSEGQSHIYLYHFNRPENDRLEKIVNLPSLNRIVYRQNFSSFSSKHKHSILIWLTFESVVIFHSCGNHFIIPGEYHHVCMKYQLFIQDRTFICCLNRNVSRIDIFEWKFNEEIHQYRLLACLQSHEKISHFECEIGMSIHH
jgi:hypothetical protein